MANGYVDLGTYVGFTPYVGAGIGYSYVSWGDLNDTDLLRRRRGACPAALSVGSTSHGGDDGWRFTYAFMAGVAYDISRNFKIDVGYKYPQHRRRRHVRLGPAADVRRRHPGRDSLDTHEIKVGLRYELW